MAHRYLFQAEAEHGSIEDLASPVLSKIAEAFVFSKKSMFASDPTKGNGVLGEGSIVIGSEKSYAHVAYFPADRTLVLAFAAQVPQGICTIPSKDFFKSIKNAMKMPIPFLMPLADSVGLPEAHVEFLESFQELENAPAGRLHLTRAWQKVTGGATPRRILCTGYCKGGGIATLAATWAALQCPTADTRCITFGAPMVGNPSFVQLFKWLVGVSYRIITFKDPVPSLEKGKRAIAQLAPVPGAIYLSRDSMTSDAPGAFSKKDIAEHSFQVYLDTMKGAIKSKLDEESRANVYKIIDTGKHAAKLRCNPETSQPLADPCAHDYDNMTTDLKQMQFPYATHNGVQQLDPFARVDASQLAAEAIAQNAATAPLDASAGIADILKGRGGEGGPPQLSNASSTYQHVTAEALRGHKTVAAEQGAPAFLRRAFSLCERDDAAVDLAHLNTLQKVLVIGKLSQAVVVAAAAYRDQSGFQQLTGIERTQMVEDSGSWDTQVHVGWLSSGTAVLAFRGTATMQDSLQDAKFLRRNIDYLQELYPGTKAHTGFMQQFAAIVDNQRPEQHIGEVLKKLSGGRRPTRILCTGHSLGGALATLGATWAAIEYPSADVRCITFGSPRVGNNKFKRAFHTLVGTSLRIIHGADPVPFMPPSLRYHHVGGTVHVSKAGMMFKSRAWHVKLRPNVADHLLIRYSRGIYQVVPGSRLPNLTPKTKGGLASPAGEEPAQELAASACQSSVGCFGFLAQDDGSDEDDTIKAGMVSDDVTEPGSPTQDGLGSPRGSSQSLQATSSQPFDSSRRLKEASSIEPRDSRSHGEEASSSIPEASSVSTAWQHSSSLPSTTDSTFGQRVEPHLTNQGKAEAITELPASNKISILEHQEAKQGIKPPSPPSPPTSKKLFKWTTSPFKQSMRLFRSSMPSSTAVAA
ncbi:hypothetical protein WJX74_003838 [Apatococcus lobatus]|uniref:Fungal lipase-type domain-containing protein n=1 Tax=Apatococcus lobatus TaxID=904363 RepID=A0AAW1S8Y4_9CHLO